MTEDKKKIQRLYQKEYHKTYGKIYRQKNKHKRNEYVRNFRKNNILYKLASNTRTRLNQILNVNKWYKTNKFKQYIGCSLEELKLYIEKQFKLEMSWENHGEWEIDHIIPLSSAKTIEELYKLCHYTNLQPLWWRDNLKKSNHCD